jgi:hypothetical protein
MREQILYSFHYMYIVGAYMACMQSNTYYLLYYIVEIVNRFSADGGSSSFMFSGFMALHYLLLNGLLEPPYRSGSPLVAQGSQPPRVSETWGHQQVYELQEHINLPGDK